MSRYLYEEQIHAVWYFWDVSVVAQITSDDSDNRHSVTVYKPPDVVTEMGQE